MANDIPFDVRPEPAKIDPYPDNQGTPGDTAATDRAIKYHYALGDKSPGVDSVYNSIISGRENEIRQQHSIDQAVEDQKYRAKALEDYLSTHKGPVTQEQLNAFQQLTKPDEPSPETGLEKKFSAKITADLYTRPGNIIEQTLDAHPQSAPIVSQYWNVLQDSVAKDEVIRKKLEDTEEGYKGHFWKGAGVTQSRSNDILETMIPFKSWYTISKLSGSGQYFLGANLAETVHNAAMMPLSKFGPWFTATYDAIAAHNPTDAQKFAEAFLSYSQSDQFWDTGFNIADLSGVTAGGKLGLKLAEGVKTSFQTTARYISAAKRLGIPDILSSAGLTSEAGKARTLRDLNANFKAYEQELQGILAHDPDTGIKKALEQTPTMMDPLSFIKGGSLREDLPPVPEFNYSLTYEGNGYKLGGTEAGNNPLKEFALNLDEHPINLRASRVEPKNFRIYNNPNEHYSADLYDIQRRGEDGPDDWETIGGVQVNFRADTNDLYVEWIGVSEGAGTIGNGELRNVLGQLRDHYPDATTITGFRISGARTGRAKAPDKTPRPIPSESEWEQMTPQERFTQTMYEQEADGSENASINLPPRRGTPIFNHLYNDTLTGTMEGKREGIIKKWNPPPPKLDREYSNRIGNGLLRQGLPALNGLADRNAVERLSVAAEVEAQDQALRFGQQEFGHLGDGVVDLAYYLPPETHPANIGQIAIYLKRSDALPFDRAEQASLWATEEYKLPEGSYTIEQQGNGWYIRVLRPIDETQPLVRQGLIETGNETPRSFFNTHFGWTRTAEDVTPFDTRKGRKTAVHGIQEAYRTIEQLTQPIRDLKGDSKRNFIRFTEALRDYQNRGIRGRFFSTMREFETEWQSMFGVLPTDRETLAYGSYIQAYEWDYVWRNLGIYRSLSRQGIRDFSLCKIDGTRTAPFKARQVNNLDWTRNDGVLILDEAGGAPIFENARNFPSEMRDLIQEGLDDGTYKVIQLAQPQLRPLREEYEGMHHLVEYVITKDFTSENIAVNQIPFTPGGHVLYDYNYYIKQPRASWYGTRRLYTHDTTVRPISFRGDAESLVQHYNEAQRLYQLRDPGFDAYVTRHIPEGAVRLRSEFESGRLSLDEPFVTVRKGQSAWDLPGVRNHYGRQVENYQVSPNNLYQTVNGEYAGERNYDLLSGNNVGTEDNPIFRLDRPKLVDPLTTLNRAMATLSRNQYLEDFRLMAAEHFVQEFQGVVSTPLEQLRSNPIAALMSPNWNEAAPRDQLMAAKNFQKSFQNFMHVQTDWGKNIGWLKENLYEATSRRLGEANADAISNSKLLKAIRDPIQFVRSVAFYEHLGLFNPAQYFKQLQTMAQVESIAGPRIAAKATPAAYLMRALLMSNESPQHIAQFARMASKIPGGMSVEEFSEAYAALRRTGLDIVEGEHAFRDDLRDPSLFSGKIGKWLNKTTIFFKEGERMTRFSAFNAAYLQWREANPIAELDRRALQYILTQQDLMNGNMTRASNAAWQSMGKGILSVPLQFATYPIRIMEQFMSPRLTGAQRARMLFTYSLLYGIPVGVGITPLGIYPWYQELGEHLVHQGIVEDPNIVVETLHKGILEVMAHAIGGKEYNAGESLGLGGLSIIKDSLDANFWKVVLGASGSTIGGIVESSIPLMKDLSGIFYDGVDGKAPLIAADFGDALRNISTVNSAYKMYYAMAYSKYWSKGDGDRGTFTTYDAILSTVFGVNPQSFDNLGYIINDTETMKGAQDFAEKQIVKYLKRGFEAKDDKTREAYFRQAEAWRVLGDFRYDQYPRILQRATEGNVSLIDAINQSYFWKNVPASVLEQRRDAFIKMKTQGNE